MIYMHLFLKLIYTCERSYLLC